MEEEGALEVNEEELGIVRDIFRTITKTVKTFSVYPRDNPIYQKFTSEVFEKFTAFFETSEELSVAVEQYSLMYKTKEVFHSDEKTDNIAMLLYADGLRQIDFYKGISADEIIDFVDILRLAPKSEADDEDDIVTLLWEKNIRNMGYTAVDDTVNDDLAVEESLQIEASNGDNVENISEGAALSDSSLSAFSHEEGGAPSLGGEQDLLKEELPWLQESSLLDSAVDLFFDLFSTEVDSDAFPETMHNIGRILDMRMQKKEVKAAIRILEGLKEISAVYRSPGQTEMISTVFLKAASPENLMALIEFSTIDDIRSYLLLLERNALSTIVTVLGDLQDRKKRRILCDILAETGRQDIPVLSEALADERWYLVRNIVMILGMTREPAAVPHLQKVLKHPDLRVRRETVRALDSIHTEEAKKLLLAGVSDSDLSVRISCLKSLRRFRDPALFQFFKKSASREELRKKPFAEKKETLETLAVLGGEDALPVLSDLFRKEKLIEKDEITELRASAAYGLGLIGTQEALSLLEKETRSRKSILREACLKAIKASGQDGTVQR
jgi:HEAT repeats